MTVTFKLDRCSSSRSAFLAMLLFGLVPGCVGRQLQFTARRTVNALPDLQYEQVVDNLAKTAANPGFLPYFAVAGQGSVQVTDNGSSTLPMSISPAAYGPGSPSSWAPRERDRNLEPGYDHQPG